jgi:hypothetical protein
MRFFSNMSRVIGLKEKGSINYSTKYRARPLGLKQKNPTASYLFEYDYILAFY